MKIIRPFYLLCVLLSSTGIIFGCDAFRNSGDVLDEAAKLIESGNNKDAIDILRPYIYKNQNSFKANLLAGQAILNMNMKDENNLYLARHYYSSASKVASTEAQRQQADQAYADIRLMMGKVGKSADTLLESAKRAEILGNSGQAVILYLQAANLYLKDKNYDDVIKTCRSGLRNNPDPENKVALSLMITRGLFLNSNVKEAYETSKTIGEIEQKMPRAYSIEKSFFKSASTFLQIEKKRAAIYSWKKHFENGDQKKFIDTFNESLNCLNKLETLAEEQNKSAISEYALILARHSINNDSKELAKRALEFSRTVFRRNGFEKEAMEVGQEIQDLEDS